jgi:hypothetical protein
MARKVSDLEDVREVSSPLFPFLMYAERPGTSSWSTLWREEAPTVIHIADRTGLDGNILRRVTRCSRRADDWHIVRFDSGERVGDGDWKYCDRCGTPDDFAAAHSEYLAGREAQKQRRADELARERDDREARLAAMRAELENFLWAYVVPDAPLLPDHRNTNDYGRVFEAGDFEILIQIVNPRGGS